MQGGSVWFLRAVCGDGLCSVLISGVQAIRCAFAHLTLDRFSSLAENARRLCPYSLSAFWIVDGLLQRDLVKTSKLLLAILVRILF